MKTKLLRKLRKKAKKAIVLVQISNYQYEIRQVYVETFKVLTYLGGAFDPHYYKKTIGKYRRDYILEKIKDIRNSIYPKMIDI